MYINNLCSTVKQVAKGVRLELFLMYFVKGTQFDYSGQCTHGNGLNGKIIHVLQLQKKNNYCTDNKVLLDEKSVLFLK